MSEKLLPDLVSMILNETGNFKKIATKELTETLLSAILNLIMKIERDIHLQDIQDSKNGFYPMSFSFWVFISMDAKVLDIRKGENEVKKAILFSAS